MKCTPKGACIGKLNVPIMVRLKEHNTQTYKNIFVVSNLLILKIIWLLKGNFISFFNVTTDSTSNWIFCLYSNKCKNTI